MCLLVPEQADFVTCCMKIYGSKRTLIFIPPWIDLGGGWESLSFVFARAYFCFHFANRRKWLRGSIFCYRVVQREEQKHEFVILSEKLNKGFKMKFLLNKTFFGLFEKNRSLMS